MNLKEFFSINNLDYILAEEGKRIKNCIDAIATKKENKIIFVGDHRQLLIFNLITNKLYFKFSDNENIRPVGRHRLDCGPYTLSWDSRTNVTSVVKDKVILKGCNNNCGDDCLEDSCPHYIQKKVAR